MDITELVRSFNALPRPLYVPRNELKNHWHISIRHAVPLTNEGYYVHIFHASHFDHLEGPFTFPDVTIEDPSPEYLSVLVWRTALPLLLDTFNSNFGLLNFYSKVSAFAPWSWATNASQVPHVRQVFKEFGIREELCEITEGDAKHTNLELIQWEEKQVRLLNPQCETCKKIAAPGKKLMLCAACKRPHYCSKACQKKAWKVHKDSCDHYKKERLRKEGAKFTTEWAIQYHSMVAPNMPDAMGLGREINLTFRKFRGMEYPMRRLVRTGKDTPENIVKMFGRYDNAVKEMQDYLRIWELLDPPATSHYAMNATKLDPEGKLPPRTPREASPEEKEEITRIREMQQLMRINMGSLPSNPSPETTKEMQRILQRYGEASHEDNVRRSEIALNAIDPKEGTLTPTMSLDMMAAFTRGVNDWC